MTLGISPGTQVEDDSAPLLIGQPGVGILNSQLRLADPGGTDYHRQGSGNEAATELLVQPNNPRTLSIQLRTHLHISFL